MPPVACPGICISPHLWQNTTMKKWLWVTLALAAGIGLGLLYGWVIDPVDFVDLTPETLRADYRADYILMVAEAYDSEHDLDLAARYCPRIVVMDAGRMAADGTPEAALSAEVLAGVFGVVRGSGGQLVRAPQK